MGVASLHWVQPVIVVVALGGIALLVGTLTLAFYRQQRMVDRAGDTITANHGISESRQEKKIR